MVDQTNKPTKNTGQTAKGTRSSQGKSQSQAETKGVKSASKFPSPRPTKS